LSDFDFSSEDSSRAEENEKIKCKKDDFTGLCSMTKGGSSWSDPKFDSDVSEDKCTHSRMLCVVKTSCFVEFFVRTKILILSWKLFC
jgi:hypothetical protein